MTDKTLSEQITSTAEGMKVWQQERAIFEITERICELMEEKGVTRAELADRLAKKRSHITQLLDGTANMTVRTLSDVFLALGRQFHVHDGPLNIENDDYGATPLRIASFTQSCRPMQRVSVCVNPVTTSA